MQQNVSVQQIIDRLVEKVLEKYPPARTRQIRERMDGLWYNRPLQDRMAYTLVNLPPENLPELPEDISPWDKELVEQLQCIVEHSSWQDDFYPAISPGIKQITIPSYFGCIEEIASASSRVKPVIHDPSDVYRLQDTGFVPGTDGREMLDKMKYFYQKTRGLIPLYETDMQGPFSVASQVWGVENFLLALYENPEEAHYLIGKCTDAIIHFFHLMYEACDGNVIPFHCMPVLWYPKEKGVAVSEDLVAVVSPSIVEEFVNPYLRKLADTFGGVFMHSCGKINHVIGALNKIAGLTGINFASTETDLPLLAREARPDLVLVSHNSPVNNTGLPLLNQQQHMDQCRDTFQQCSRNGICILFPWNADLKVETHRDAFRKAAIF